MGETFGGMLRRLRLGSDLTQEELAERAGLSVAAVASLERGRRHAPRPSTLRKLAEGLDLEAVDVDRLRSAAPKTRGGSAAALRQLGPHVPVAVTPERAAGRSFFVGRAAELETLRGAWTRRRRFTLVTGEAGIGKSRLVAELVDEVRGGGGLVALGRCSPDELGAYEPFVDLLRQVVLAFEPSTLEEAVGGRGELSRLIPELDQHIPDLAPPVQADEGTERRFLFEAVRALLASCQPALIVLEDLHWAGRSSLALLDYLLASSSTDGLVFVATARTDEPASRGTAGLFELRRHTAVDRLALGGLEARELAQLLAGLTGATPPQALVDWVLAASDGNPFLAEAVGLHLVKEGSLDDARSQSGTISPPARLAPAEVSEGLLSRLSRLGEETVAFLNTAALVGREFDVGLAMRAAGLGAASTADLVDEALSSGLVTEARPGRLSFRHAIVRDAVVEGLSSVRQADLHRRLGEVLETDGGGEPAVAGEIARHFTAASLADPALSSKAAAWAMAAGDAFLAAVAVSEAIASYEQSSTLWPPDSRGRCEALLRLGRALHYSGHGDEADLRFREAIELARALGDAELCAETALGLGFHFQIGVIDCQRVRALEEALEGLGAKESHLRPMLQTLLATQIALDRSPGSAARRDELARDVVRAATDPEASPELLLALGRCPIANCVRDPFALAQVSQRILDLARELGDTEVLGEIWYARCWSAFERADLEDLLASLDLGAEVGSRRSSARDISTVAMVQASLATLQGKYADAMALAEEALEHGIQAGNPNAQLIYFAQQMLRDVDVGDAGALVPLMQATDPSGERTSIVGGAALCAALAGQHELARSIMAPVAGRLAELAEDVEGVGALALIAHACAQIGDSEKAPELYKLLSEETAILVRIGPLAGSWGPIDHHLGSLCRLQGDLVSAEEHLRRALQIEDGAKAVPFRARSEIELARVLSQGGGDGEARELAEMARSRAVALGARQIADEALAFLCTSDSWGPNRSDRHSEP